MTAQEPAPAPVKDPLTRLTKAGTLLVFGASWCGPSQLMGPLLDRVRGSGVDVRDVDIDEWPQHAETFRVLSVPTLVWVREGAERRRLIGAVSPPELKAFVSRK